MVAAPPPYLPPTPGGGFVPPPDSPPTPIGPDKNEAVTVFVLGLLGLVLCQLLAPIAWRKGNTYRDTCMILEVPPDGLATAGRIMGIVGTILLGLSLAWMLVVFTFMFASR